MFTTCVGGWVCMTLASAKECVWFLSAPLIQVKGASSKQGNASSHEGSASGVLLQVNLTGKHLQLLDCPTNLPIGEESGGGASANATGTASQVRALLPISALAK